jgi:hypothetical protein
LPIQTGSAGSNARDEVGGEDRPLPQPDEAVERPPLGRGEIEDGVHDGGW